MTLYKTIKNVLSLTLFLFCLVNYTPVIYANEGLIQPANLFGDLDAYLLPDHHTVKKELDQIFRKKRVTLNKKTLKKAGFYCIKKKSKVGFYVFTHSSMPNYIFKVYTDEMIDSCEQKNFLKRIHGALYVKAVIKHYGWENIFVVPKKWVYRIPDFPAPPEGYKQRKYILVAEKIPLVSSGSNYAKWYSPVVTKPLLKNVYTLFEEVGLWDSALPSNLFFTLDGRLAIIDTEYHHMWPVRYRKLDTYLMPAMATYWQRITASN